MKKILAKVALVSALVSSAQAGAVLDLEVGGGMWAAGTPSGSFTSDGVQVDMVNQLNLGSPSGSTYGWAVVDHLIPVVPNIRVEQVSISSEGQKNINILGLIDGNLDSELDLSNKDLILYWGLPFATWLPFIDELDFGLGLKAFDGGLLIEDTLGLADPVSEDFNFGIPYGYGKLRIEPPLFMGVGLEGELKYFSVSSGSDSFTFTEYIVKADWGMMFPLPIIDIKPGVELGYRDMSIDVDSSDAKADLGFSGLFFGVYAKFGL